MKKIALFIMILISSVCLVACGKSTISYTESSVKIYENEEYTIDENKVNISGKVKDYLIISEDENVARVDGNTIIPISVGKTTIRLKLNVKKDVHCDIDFEVTKGKIAKNASVQKSRIDIDMADENITSVNKIVTNNDCDEIPVITYDSNIINYDYISGVVTALSSGSTKVIIEYKHCKTSFDVFVTKNIYTSLMIVEDMNVYENSEGKLDFSVFPSNANTYTFYLSEEDKDRTDFIIYSDGTYKSQNKTKITLNYFYYDAKNHRSEIKSFKVNVVEKLTDFDVEFTDQNGAVVDNFLVNNTYKITIKIDNSLGAPVLNIDGNFVKKSSLQYVENSGYEMKIQFDVTGKANININYNLQLGSVDNKLHREFNLDVNDKANLTIGGKWLGLELQCIDGKYTIYLDGLDGNRPNEIAIMLKVNGNFDTTLSYKVFKIMPDNSKEEVGYVFVPENVGEYIFEVEFEDEIVGQIVVLVE